MTTSTRQRSNWLLTGLVFVGSLTVLIPMYFTVIVAIKGPEDMLGSPWVPPAAVQWENFVNAFEVTNFPRALMNSTIITAGTVVLTVLTNSLVGYAIARNIHRPAFKGMYFYLLSAMFIPFPILMLPLVKQMAALGLDNIWGVILLYVVYNLSFNTLLYVGYMNTIPVAIDEAAIVDGASPWRSFWSVIFPLLGPMNVTVAILTGLRAWNDFLLPLVILSDESQHTLPLTQYVFQGQFTSDYNLGFASYLMAMTPMVLFYLFAQKWIIGGVSRGAVK